jgi:hypothetical protein
MYDNNCRPKLCGWKQFTINRSNRNCYHILIKQSVHKWFLGQTDFRSKFLPCSLAFDRKEMRLPLTCLAQEWFSHCIQTGQKYTSAMCRVAFASGTEDLGSNPVFRKNVSMMLCIIGLHNQDKNSPWKCVACIEIYILMSMVAWHSPSPQERKTRVRIPPGYKVFRKNVSIMLLCIIGLNT